MAISTIEKVTNNSDTGYCKMPDGTMIEWGSFSVTIPANSYAEQEVSFPVHFSAAPSFTAGITAWADPRTYSILRRAVFGATGTLRIGSTFSSATTVQVDWIAVGRWK